MMPNAGHPMARATTIPLCNRSGFFWAGESAVLRLVLWFLTLSFAAAAQGWISNDQAKPARMEDALREAFADPYGFYDRGEHKALVTLVEKHIDASFAVAPPGELDYLITSAEKNNNAVLLFVFNLLLSVQDRQSHPEKSCAALAAAAGTLFKQLDEPEAALALNRAALRRSCPDAADAIRRVEEYLRTDQPIALLLRERWYDEDEKQRVLYARAMELALDAHPSTALRVDAMQRIGDVYYDLKKFRSMRKWYRAVAATDSTLLRETTVGIRLEEAANRIMRQNLSILFMAFYAAAGIFLAARIIRSWRTFDAVRFFKRLGLFLALYLLAAAAVFFIDARLFPAEVGNLKFGSEYPFPVTKPAVPLGTMDTSFFPMRRHSFCSQPAPCGHILCWPRPLINSCRQSAFLPNGGLFTMANWKNCLSRIRRRS